MRRAPDGDIGPPRLALGLVAHRVDDGDPRDGGCDAGLRGAEDTGGLETRGLKLWNLIAALICVVGVIGLLLAVLHGIECGIWAAAYLRLGVLDSPTDALFFSLDSMSTRGASGLTLQRPWQMMGALEAVDWMLLFGVSTAFLFWVLQAYWSMLTAHATPSKG
jgi:hypothetical protein